MKRTRTRSARPAAPVDMSRIKARVEWVDITDIQPYPYNPRDNRKAIASVAKSIQNFGFIVPVVIDSHGVLAAGHTRVEAAKTLQLTEVLAVRAEHLSQEQIDAFRIIDNKVAELSDWDTDLLGPEIARVRELMGDSIDFADYGWSQEEIDCLTQIVASDCLASVVEVDLPEEVRIAERRAPANTRIVLGELVFFVPTTVYRNWVDGVRRLHNFSESAIVEDLKTRLGILEE